MAKLLEKVYQECNDHLNEISKLFQSGVKLTLIARSPGHPERDFMMSVDDLVMVQELIKRRQEAMKDGLRTTKAV